ncbi:MAG: Fic family protein [Verrucomicrobiaceae bacterium]|nr:MAG: Fic family protein [Verrucomicrobiaceae bacterium]
MPQKSSMFRRLTSMEPLLPASGGAELAELSVEIFRKSGELMAALPSKTVRCGVAALVREMNSYYSNLIEGHKTLPRDIERALRDDFSDREEDRRNQLMSVAHIRAEQAMRQRLADEADLGVFEPAFVQWLHREFYGALPEEEWFTTSVSGNRYPIAPGEFRGYNVDVGRHTPPDHEVLGDFMRRFADFYSGSNILATGRLIAAAAAHHRLAWIHPFGDGNGRVARLQSQAVMIRSGLDAEGLWTLSRGFARSRAAYFQHLQGADQPRANDFDGRGNLSDAALSRFCRFFLERCLDQISFMTDLIAPFNLLDRIESYLRFTRVDLESKTREHLQRLLKALCLEGEITRGAVSDVLGLKGTAARAVIRRALDEELVCSSSEKGPLRIAFPHKVLDAWFPQLFTDLPVQEP